MNLRAIACAVALVLLGLGAWWIDSRAVERTEAKVRAQIANASLVVVQEDRASENRINFGHRKVDDDLYSIIQAHRAAAARDAAAARGVRGELARIHAAVAGDDPAAAARCQAALGGVASVLESCVSEYGELARDARDYLARGLKCAGYYDAVEEELRARAAAAQAEEEAR